MTIIENFTTTDSEYLIYQLPNMSFWTPLARPGRIWNVGNGDPVRFFHTRYIVIGALLRFLHPNLNEWDLNPDGFNPRREHQTFYWTHRKFDVKKSAFHGRECSLMECTHSIDTWINEECFWIKKVALEYGWILFLGACNVLLMPLMAHHLPWRNEEGRTDGNSDGQRSGWMEDWAESST